MKALTKITRRGKAEPMAEKALQRSARAARKIARMHGTPIYVWKNG